MLHISKACYGAIRHIMKVRPERDVIDNKKLRAQNCKLGSLLFYRLWMDTRYPHVTPTMNNVPV
ncbi:hypothetical protein JRO89_XS09G0226400 [Xanthoceras sorbifolium]|uniref:Uncharacterized protein n=1 Tax=Xanthoceras sorbifolium TaxID=99658 RepID=A0ABQ8HMQ7_9ROSI|nr:hypothetical protein JRO89_XS09G0226400 [Xanthoceras sorbifolium]